MPIYAVNVKFGKEKLKVDCDTDSDVQNFKACLFSLTGVSPENQKVMAAGKILNDSFENFTVKNNMTMMLLGSATLLNNNIEMDLVKENEITVTQDENEHISIPIGLINLGNSCYINATVQCLKTIPELTHVYEREIGLIGGFLTLLKKMEESDLSEFNPLVFVYMIRSLPQFDGKDENGQNMQQDANECWIKIITTLSKSQINPEYMKNIFSSTTPSDRFLERFLSIQLQIEVKPCIEENETNSSVDIESLRNDVSYSNETVYQLSCFIAKEMKYLDSGIRRGLEDEITKYSEITKSDIKFCKKSAISRAPAYLTINLVRFFYKGGKEINAKIMKEVKYSINLDVYDYCSPELKTKMLPYRQRLKEQDDAIAVFNKELKMLQNRNPGEALAYERKLRNVEYESYSFPDDVGTNHSGKYELQAVLTHHGRLSKSGHYIAWIKKDEVWFKCDDDDVTMCTEEQILRLAGGGDWHTAYILLYGPKRLRKTPIESISLSEN